MPLRLTGHIALPAHQMKGGFDHADILESTNTLYIAHTANDSIDIVDCENDLYVRSIPDVKAVAGIVASQERNVVFTTNRDEGTVSILMTTPAFSMSKLRVGLNPNGLCFAHELDILLAANVGDPRDPNTHSVTILDIKRRQRLCDLLMPGRSRWVVYDHFRKWFFVNIERPAAIVAIDARHPASIVRTYAVPGAGPHGLAFDPLHQSLLCACDDGRLFAIDIDSGSIDSAINLSGPPDVIFLNPKNRRLYVAVGDPGVIDVIDMGSMSRIEVIQTESGAHTIAIDVRRNKVFAFLPASHCAAVFQETST